MKGSKRDKIQPSMSSSGLQCQSRFRVKNGDEGSVLIRNLRVVLGWALYNIKEVLLIDWYKQTNGAGRYMCGLFPCLQGRSILVAQCQKGYFVSTEIWANNQKSGCSRPRTRSFAGGHSPASSLALRRAGQL